MNGGDFWTVLFVVGAAWAGWKLLLTRESRHAVEKAEVPNASSIPAQEDKQARHMRDALSYVKTQHRELTWEKQQREAWEMKHGLSQVEHLDGLSGIEFEVYLGGIFKKQGFKVEFTPTVADYGADLLISRGDRRIAVQAKRYAGTVGISAVQEAISGMAYYGCTEAWVVTTGTFTPNAVGLAAKSSVKLVNRSDLAKTIYSVNGVDRGQ